MLHRCTTLGRTSKLQFLQIFGRRNAFTIRCVFSYKIVNGMAPSYMSNLLPNLVRDNNPYNLRNRNNIAIPRVRLSVPQNSFFPATISLWNNLSENTRNMPTFNSFKRSLEPLNRHSFNNGRILERKYEVILARLKYSCSSLNADLHRVNF